MICFKIYRNMTASLLELLLIFSLAINSIRSDPTCRCVNSSSIYLTTVTKPMVTSGTTTTSATFETTSRLPSTKDPSESKLISSVFRCVFNNAITCTITYTTARSQIAEFISINTKTGLSLVTIGASFNESSPGYTGNNTTNFFTIPAGKTEPRIVVDLLIGPTGAICRPMPYIEQICVSSYCDGCNLNFFTAAAATSATGDSVFSLRIIYPTSIVNTTVCAGRDVFERFGDFRYIVFLAQGSPSPSQPYAFRIGIIGNFSAYNCPSRRRRSAEAFANARVLDEYSQMLSRLRRAVSNNCSCPVGQDPVFSSTTTVLISWMYLWRPFNSVLSNKSSSEYISLARESYYLLMDAVRNSPLSKLASVVADFYDIEFSSDSGGNNTNMIGKLSVRNDTECGELCSSSFFLDQLKTILPGYGSRFVNLNVTSPLDVPLSSSVSSLSVLLIVIIALAVIVFNIALSIGLGVTMCRLKKIKKAMAAGDTPVCKQNDQALGSSDAYDYMAPDVTPTPTAEFASAGQDAYDYIGSI